MVTGASEDDRILIVDDENGVRELMARWLQTTGYAVRTAATADEALGAMDEAAAAVALCDIRLPGRDGLWLAGQLRKGYPETAVIMATGVQEVGSAVTSLRQGVVDYLMKPFGRDRLRDAVRRGIDWHHAAVEARRWREQLEQETRSRQTQLAEALAVLKIDSDDAIDALLATLTIHNRAAYEHAYRVAALAVALARTLDLDEAAIRQVEHAAILHDIGKMALPDAVVRKPSALSMEEQDIVRRHPDIASELLGAVPFLSEAAAIVRAVPEWFSGAGYPRGLAGEEIPTGSRIVAVADAFDTMTHPRVFRDVLAAEDALLEMARCRGTQFDPTIVDALHRLLPRGRPDAAGH